MMKKYDMTTKDIIEEELAKIPFLGCETYIFEYPREANDIDNLTTSRFGLTLDDKPIVEFYTSVIDQIYEDQKSFIEKRYSSKEKYIQCIVRHENRHYQQYQYAKDNGIDINVLDKDEDLEKDAYDYENGIVNDLVSVFHLNK